MTLLFIFLFSLIKIQISNNTYSDEIFIRFKDNSSINFEGNNDAWKMFSLNSNVPQVYTLIDNSPASLNTVPFPNHDTVVSIHTKQLKQDSVYNLSIKLININYQTFFINNNSYEIIDSLNLQIVNDTCFDLYFNLPPNINSIPLTCFKLKDGQINFNDEGNPNFNLTLINQNNTYYKTVTNINNNYCFNNLFADSYQITQYNYFGYEEQYFIDVTTPYPVLCNWELNKNTFLVGEAINFVNISDSVSCLWDFGDNNLDTNCITGYSYFIPGLYLVSLILQNKNCFDTCYNQLLIVDSTLTNVIDIKAIEGPVTIRIYDLLGQLLYEQTYDKKITFKFEPNKLYLVTVQTKTSIVNKLFWLKE